MVKTCVLCGKQFEAKTKTAKICYDKHFRNCVVCGKQFELKRSYLKQQTCSAKCSKVLRKQHAEQTSLEKYGVKNAGWTKKSQAKIKATNREKYGSDTFFSSDIGKAKIKESNLEKYGVENAQQREEVKAKTRKTN